MYTRLTSLQINLQSLHKRMLLLSTEDTHNVRCSTQSLSVRVHHEVSACYRSVNAGVMRDKKTKYLEKRMPHVRLVVTLREQQASHNRPPPANKHKTKATGLRPGNGRRRSCRCWDLTTQAPGVKEHDLWGLCLNHNGAKTFKLKCEYSALCRAINHPHSGAQGSLVLSALIRWKHNTNFQER